MCILQEQCHNMRGIIKCFFHRYPKKGNKYLGVERKRYNRDKFAMDKYRIIDKPKDKAPNFEIRVTANTQMRSYLGYIASLFESKNEKIVIKGTGYAISRAISLSTLIRHKFKGLHQIVDIGSMEMVDEYEPIEEGLDKVTLKRKVALVTVTLSTKPLDESHAGYSAPLPDSEVTPYQPFLPSAGGERGRGRGRGRGGRRGGGFRGRMSRGRGRGRRGGFRGRGRGGYGGYQEQEREFESEEMPRRARRGGRFRGRSRGSFRGMRRGRGRGEPAAE